MCPSLEINIKLFEQPLKLCIVQESIGTLFENSKELGLCSKTLGMFCKELGMCFK